MNIVRVAHVLCPGLSGLVLLIVALSLALVACASPTPTPTPIPTAQDGDSVMVHYTGTLDDGSEFDSSRDRFPLEFVVGSGQMIAGFDNGVRGLALGETVTVRIEPADAYGELDADLILDVPIAEFPPEMVGQLAIGMSIPLSNGMQPVITNITDAFITLNANHALAGEALTFEIELVELTKPASAPEPTPAG